MEQLDQRNRFETLKELLEEGIPEFSLMEIIREITAMCDDYTEAEKYLRGLLLNHIEDNFRLCIAIFHSLTEIVRPSKETLKAINIFSQNFKLKTTD